MDENFLRNAVAASGWGADITRIKVVRDKYNGMHAGYGFLDAASPDAAARVLANGSGMPIPGTNRCWRLNMGRNAQGGGAAPGAGAETNVYVGDLEPSVTDYELMSAFRPRFPSTRHAKVVCNDYGQSRGFGFVRFASAEEAERAVQEMNGFEFRGKPIRLSPANGRSRNNHGSAGGGSRGGYGHHMGGPSNMHIPHSYGAFGHGPTHKRPRQVMAPDDPNNTTLFIGGTGPHVTEEVLWREFSIFGELEAVRVPVTKTGFAFVRFKTRDAAQRAKNELSGTHFISLNASKPVRLEWASEQLAVTKPPPAHMPPVPSQAFAPYAYHDSNAGGPSAATGTDVSGTGANSGNVPISGTSTAKGAAVDSVPTANGGTGNSGTAISEGDAPPSKRAAVGRPEYSPNREPSDKASSVIGEEFSRSTNAESVASMPFPWLNTPTTSNNTTDQ